MSQHPLDTVVCRDITSWLGRLYMLKYRYAGQVRRKTGRGASTEGFGETDSDLPTKGLPF